MANMFDDLFEETLGGWKAEKRKKVGGYVLSKTLGEGSFAKVRLATHILTKEKVAIKVISKRLVRKKEYVKKNLRREALMLQKLQHPNIVRLYEVMETENAYYLVTELAEGGDFMKYLSQKHCFTESEARRYMRQIISAVDHMHRSGVIHRDLKIENLLLDNEMNIKIIDFGLSNVWDGQTLLTTQCGSPAYAAPEIFSKREYGTAVDIWSIGVNMYAMLVGQLPFLIEPPTNLTKLHSTILKGCKVPEHFSSGCKDLIPKLLEPVETKRITMPELMRHPWLNEDYVTLTSWPLKCPLTPGELDQSVVRCIVNNYRASEADVVHSLVKSRTNVYYAAYHLLSGKVRKKLGLPETSTFSHGLSEGLISEMKKQTDTDSPQGSATEDLNSSVSVAAQDLQEDVQAGSSSSGKSKQRPTIYAPFLEPLTTVSLSADPENRKEVKTPHDFKQSHLPESAEHNPNLNKENSCASSYKSDLTEDRNTSAGSQRPRTPRTTYRSCLKELRQQKPTVDEGSFTREVSDLCLDPLDCVVEANRVKQTSNDSKTVRFQISPDKLERAQLTPSEVNSLSERFMVGKMDSDKAKQAMAARNECYGEDTLGQLLNSDDASNQMHALDILHSAVQQQQQPPPAPPNSALGGRRPYPITSAPVSAPLPPPPPPSLYRSTEYRLRESAKLASSRNDDFYDNYRFKIRKAGEPVLMTDMNGESSSPQMTRVFRRSKTMPDIKTRKLGLVCAERQDKQVNLFKEFPVKNLGAFYTMPDPRFRSARTFSRTRPQRPAIKASLPVTWKAHAQYDTNIKPGSSSSYLRCAGGGGNSFYRQQAPVSQSLGGQPLPIGTTLSNPNK